MGISVKLAGVATAALLAMTAGASAATANAGTCSPVDGGWATCIEYEGDNALAKRGTDNDRANPLNALGQDDGDFFEIGLGSYAIFQFGSTFGSPGSTVEVTNGNRADWLEEVAVYASLNGVMYDYITTFDNSSATNNIVFAGIYNFLKLVDISPLPPQGTTGGWDVDSIKVTPVPVPSAIFLLLGALGGLGYMTRRAGKENAAA